MRHGRSGTLVTALTVALASGACGGSTPSTDELDPVGSAVPLEVADPGPQPELAENSVLEGPPADGSWDVVGIGDSFIGWSTVVERYADLVGADIGADVDVHKIANGTSNRLEYLRTTETAQRLLSEAEIVIVEPQPGPATGPGMADYTAGTCGGADNQDCFRRALADFRPYVGSLLDELIASTPADTTIIVVLVGTWGPAAFRPGLSDEDPEALRVFVDHVVALQELSAAAAAERGIPYVDVSRVFNGSDYRQPVPEGYLLPDRMHLTDEGSRVVAELLHALSDG